MFQGPPVSKGLEMKRPFEKIDDFLGPVVSYYVTPGTKTVERANSARLQ
jgi:hypothetical protein